MAKTEKRVIVSTSLGAMHAQTKIEKKYRSKLDGFAVVYVSPVAPDKYRVCFEFNQQTSTQKS